MKSPEATMVCIMQVSSNEIPHSHQKLSCLKNSVSYSSIVSLPINQE